MADWEESSWNDSTYFVVMSFFLIGPVIRLKKWNPPLLVPCSPGYTWHLSWCGSDLRLWSPGALPPHRGSCSALLPPAGRPRSVGIGGRDAGRWVSIFEIVSPSGRIVGELVQLRYCCLLLSSSAVTQPWSSSATWWRFHHPKPF